MRKISKSHELLLHWLAMITFTQYITLFNDFNVFNFNDLMYFGLVTYLHWVNLNSEIA